MLLRVHKRERASSLEILFTTFCIYVIYEKNDKMSLLYISKADFQHRSRALFQFTFHFAFTGIKCDLGSERLISHKLASSLPSSHSELSRFGESRRAKSGFTANGNGADIAKFLRLAAKRLRSGGRGEGQTSQSKGERNLRELLRVLPPLG